MKKGLIFTALMCTLTMGLVACGNNASDTPQVPVATLSSIKLNIDNVEKTFKVGDTFSSAGLVVTAKYSDGSEKAVEAGKYSVSSPDMSTSGTKVVTVTYEGKTAQYNITVEPAEIVVSITNKEDFEPEWRVGDSSRTLKLSVTGVVVDAAIRSGDLVISASNPEVVGIDGREISAKAAGTTTITATYKGDASDSVEVTVLPKKLLSKVLNPVEEEEYLLARADGNNPNALMYVKNDMSNTFYLGYESDRTKAPVLTVKIDESAEDYKYELVFDAGTDNEHNIGALCTAKGKYATGFVGNKISGLDVPQTFWKVDELGQLWCKVQDDGADVELLLGGAGIYNTTSADLPSKIKNPAFIYTENAEEKPATEINVSPESLELVPGQNKRLTVSLLPADTTDTVSYIPSNTDVIEVSDDGIVTALTAGEADILVKANDDVSKTVHVVVSGEAIKFGTREAPLTVDEVLAEIVKCADEGDSSSYPFYVSGKVSSSTYNTEKKNATITLKGTSGNLEAYRAIGDEGIDVSTIKATDEILVVGYSDIYNKKLQLAPLANAGTKEYGDPTVLSVVPGEGGDEPEDSEYGSFESPLTPEQAVAFLDKYFPDGNTSSKDLYVEGEVSEVSSHEKPNIWLKSSDGATAKYFESYMSTMADGVEKPEVGDTVIIKGKAKIYTSGSNKTYELTNVGQTDYPQVLTVTKGEGGGGGEEIPEPTLVKGTIAEFLADTAGNGKQLYEVKGTVSKWANDKSGNPNPDGTKYGNFYMTDDSGAELYVYGATSNAEKLAWNSTSGVYSFSNPQDFLTGELTKDIRIGSVVTMKVTRCDYKTTLEGQGIVTAVEEGEGGGGGEEIPEPTLVKGTIAEFLADTAGNGKQLYEVKGTVSKWANDKSGNPNPDGTKYGNFYMTDDSGAELYVYGATSNAEKLAWNSTSGVYSFSNPQDFLTGELTKDIRIGSVVTMKVTRCDYKTTLEGQGIVTAVENEVVELTGIKFDVEGDSIDLIEGRTKAIKLLPLPEFAELPEEDPTWESSNPEVATIAEGNNVGALITAVKEGTAKITAKYSDKIKAEITVNVVKDSGEEPAYVDATMTKGTNAYDDVKVNGKPAIKVGKSSAGGDMTITVGAGATELVFYAAAWNGVTGLALNITGATVNPTSVDLTADSAIAGTATDYAISDESQYKFVIALSNITEETVIKLEGSIAKRFVVWGAQYK